MEASKSAEIAKYILKTIWFPFLGSHNKYIQKLQQLQNKTLSITSNASSKILVTPLYKKYGLLKLADSFNYEMAKIMYISVFYTNSSLTSYLHI